MLDALLNALSLAGVVCQSLTRVDSLSCMRAA